MARGAESKANVMAKILETFDGAFEYGKELRIPMDENGERVEIKVTLTCAKVNVGGGDAGEIATTQDTGTEKQALPPTEEEKKNIDLLMQRLGI